MFILWFGWYGFNPGSALAIVGASEIAALCAVTTTLAAAAGTLSTLALSMALSYSSTNRIVWDTIAAGNGALAGLVSITAGTSVVHPWAAIVIGIIGGGVYVASSNFMAHVIKVDDPLDAVAVHGFCGIWGLLAAASFADEDLMRLSYGNANGYGFIAGGDGKLLVAALTGIAVIFIWVMGWMIPFFLLTKVLGLLRVDAAEEHEGLDISHHGGSAYPKDMVKMEGGADLRKEMETMKAEIEMLRQKS